MRRAILAVLALVLLAGCDGQSSASGGGLTGNRLDPPFTVSPTALTDTSGRPYSLTKDTDKPLTLVFFGYTHCPDICGVVMANLATAVTRLSPADAAKVDVVYVTTDPARDTEKVLERYLAHVHPGFIGLTGDLTDITAIARPLGVAVEQGAKLPSGGYDVTHGTTITGIDSRDQGSVYWSQETSSAQFAADIHTLLSEEN